LSFWLTGLALTAVTGLGCQQNDAEEIVVHARPPAVANTSQSAIARDVRPLPAVISKTEPIVEATLRFSDVAEQVGVHFRYDNGALGQSLMVEATGGAAAWFDYDLDGVLDLFLAQGGSPLAEPMKSRETDRLFRGQPTGEFVSVEASAGLNDDEYSQGMAVADFDNDGFDDVYVTSIRHNALFRNQGDGTFLNVTETSGVDDPRWSTSAAWGDLDQDGDLDLYVCNYVDFDPHHPKICLRTQSAVPAMCNPKDFKPVADECFENLGDGTFRRVAEAWGLQGPDNRALGVAIADFNNDGRPDIFVANDTTANFLFLNRGSQRFEESAMLLGCALSAQGAGQANMGVAVGDYDRNGFLDLYVTHFTGEYHTLYRNLGPEGFQDRTSLAGLAKPPLNKLGFGTVMTDFDQDGRVELFVANGHVDPGSGGPEEYEMEPQLFTFRGRTFQECSSAAGKYFHQKWVGRGVAQGDFDNDGDWDLAVVHHNAPAAVLRNDSERGHWLKLKAIGRLGPRTPIGLRITLRQGQQSWMQELAGGTSYCSAHESALIFGVGPSSEPCDLEIRWPSGTIQRMSQVALDQTLQLLEPDK
jgi:hypothetical protein